MKTEFKPIKVALTERVGSFAPRSVARRRKISSCNLFISFAEELDEQFAKKFRTHARPDTKLLVLNDTHSVDKLIESLFALRIRTPERFYVTDPPRSDMCKEDWAQLIAALLGRVWTASKSKSGPERILNSKLEEDVLRVISMGFRRLAVPLSKIRPLANADEQARRNFEIDEDGAFIYWPDLNVHLGWEQLVQAIDPKAAQRARQKHSEFNVRYGAAIRKFREGKQVSSSSITGLSEKQLHRIETGRCRLTSNAAQKLAAAHGMPASEYLDAIAQVICSATGRIHHM